MSNSHRPTDTTRQCCLCRVRRCELSLETVWQNLNSELVAWRLVKKFTFSHIKIKIKIVYSVCQQCMLDSHSYNKIQLQMR